MFPADKLSMIKADQIEPLPKPHGCSMTEIKVVLFDLGNVLIEWNPDFLFSKLIPDADQRRKYLEKINFDDWNAEQDRGRSWEEAEAVLVEKFPQDENLIRSYRRRFLETIGPENIEVVRILEELKRSNLKLYAASNWNAETFEIMRSRMPFLGLFDDVCISGKLKLAKPDIKFFQTIMRMHKFEPTEAIFIDDLEKNVAAAKSLGISSILFRNATELANELEKKGLLSPKAGRG